MRSPQGWARLRRMSQQLIHCGGARVKNPLDSLWGTVICGVILTAILFFVAKMLVTGSMVG